MSHFIHRIRFQYFFVPFVFSIVSIYSVYQASADSDGWIGSSKKGCGGSGCHANSASSATQVSIETLSKTIIAGKTYNFTLTVSNGSALTAGCNISAQKGTLGRVLGGGGLVFASKELTHSAPMEMSLGSTTFRFTYKAPATAGPDVIYAVGLGTNGNLAGDASDKWSLTTYPVTVVASSSVPNSTEDEEPSNSLLVMSNPVKNATDVRITSNHGGTVVLSLFDIAGKKVLEKKLGVLNARTSTVPLDLRMIHNGQYLVECMIDGSQKLYSKLAVGR